MSVVKINLGGKQYSSQSEDRKKNDEVIMESAKKLIGGVLITEDKNLLVRYRIPWILKKNKFWRKINFTGNWVM